MTCRHLPLTLSLALALLASGAVAHANPGGVAQATSNRHQQGGEAFAPLPVDQPPPAAPAPASASDTAERQAAPLQTQFDELVEQGGILVGRDCPECPEMVVVPAGSYRMGSRDGYPDEEPVHKVTIGAPFAVGRYEVTFAEWDACVRSGGCPQGERIAKDRGWGRGRRPVIHVSWHDAKRYVNWLSRKTRKPYRLLSESEWEYAARAGTETAYSWGDEIGVNRANCEGCGSHWDDSKTAPVGSFSALGVCTTCTATCWAGWKIAGTTVTRARRWTGVLG